MTRAGMGFLTAPLQCDKSHEGRIRRPHCPQTRARAFRHSRPSTATNHRQCIVVVVHVLPIVFAGGGT